jgi:RNA recognition motif-containing protein
MGWRSPLFPAEPEKAVKMEIRIYVGNLAKSTTEAEIKQLFEKAGEVTIVDLVKDRDSGQSKGFAFVTMTNQADADKAISMYNAYSLAGNEIKVNIAKPRVERGAVK